MAYLLAAAFEDLGPRQQQHVETRAGLPFCAPERLAQQAFHAVACAGVPEPARQHEAEAVPLAPVRACHQQEQPPLDSLAAPQQALEVCRGVDALRGPEGPAV
jgi:hypothetical protein